jgi:hypothetical protein
VRGLDDVALRALGLEDLGACAKERGECEKENKIATPLCQTAIIFFSPECPALGGCEIKCTAGAAEASLTLGDVTDGGFSEGGHCVCFGVLLGGMWSVRKGMGERVTSRSFERKLFFLRSPAPRSFH